MKTWQFAAVALACLALAGCRNDPRVTALERHNRMLEDEIYRLRWMIEDFQEGGDPISLDDLDRPGRFAPAGGEPSTRAPRGVPDVRVDIPGVDIPGVDISGVEVSPEEALDRLRRGSVPEGIPPGVRDEDDAAGSRTTDPAKLPDEAPRWSLSAEPIMPGPARLEEGTGPILPADSREVTQLVLNRQLTGGLDTDGLPGDEGIVVVLEPRDAEGRWLEAPAEVTVVLLDPALEGEAARVARWDFTAAETIGRFCETGGGRGIELTMRWSAGTPQHSDLLLYARYTTSDGRELQVDAPIRVALPGERSAGWVPSEQRPSERQAIRPAEPPPSHRREKDFPHRMGGPEPRSRRPVWSAERHRATRSK